MTTTQLLTPTSAWLAHCADFLEPLQGPEGTAERLLLLLHYGIDWEGSWLATHRANYWDRHLPDRVLIATYMSNSLPSWWTMVATDLSSSPRTAAERKETAQLLQQPSVPVLRALREQTEALVLRARIVAETVRATRPSR